MSAPGNKAYETGKAQGERDASNDILRQLSHPLGKMEAYIELVAEGFYGEVSAEFMEKMTEVRNELRHIHRSNDQTPF